MPRQVPRLRVRLVKYAFDSAGRLTKITDYDSTTYDYTYDASGNVITTDDYERDHRPNGDLGNRSYPSLVERTRVVFFANRTEPGRVGGYKARPIMFSSWAKNCFLPQGWPVRVVLRICVASSSFSVRSYCVQSSTTHGRRKTFR